jgi:hypothetical protein
MITDANSMARARAMRKMPFFLLKYLAKKDLLYYHIFI